VPDEWRADPGHNENREDDNLPPPPIQFRSKITKQMLATESDEVKAEVEAYCDSTKEDKGKRSEVSLDDSERYAKAKSYEEWVRLLSHLT
jgi:hypothetical protein